MKPVFALLTVLFFGTSVSVALSADTAADKYLSFHTYEIGKNWSYRPPTQWQANSLQDNLHIEFFEGDVFGKDDSYFHLFAFDFDSEKFIVPQQPIPVFRHEYSEATLQYDSTSGSVLISDERQGSTHWSLYGVKSGDLVIDSKTAPKPLQSRHANWAGVVCGGVAPFSYQKGGELSPTPIEVYGLGMATGEIAWGFNLTENPSGTAYGGVQTCNSETGVVITFYYTKTQSLDAVLSGYTYLNGARLWSVNTKKMFPHHAEIEISQRGDGRYNFVTVGSGSAAVVYRFDSETGVFNTTGQQVLPAVAEAKELRVEKVTRAEELNDQLRATTDGQKPSAEASGTPLRYKTSPFGPYGIHSWVENKPNHPGQYNYYYNITLGLTGELLVSGASKHGSTMYLCNRYPDGLQPAAWRHKLIVSLGGIGYTWVFVKPRNPSN